MSSRTRPISIRTVLLLSLTSLVKAVSAQALIWAPAGSPGGAGTWDATTPAWLDGGSLVVHQPAADVDFPAPGGGSVAVHGLGSRV